jgi:hypothetical protein
MSVPAQAASRKAAPITVRHSACRRGLRNSGIEGKLRASARSSASVFSEQARHRRQVRRHETRQRDEVELALEVVDRTLHFERDTVEQLCPPRFVGLLELLE